MQLTKSTSTDAITISNAMKKHVLSLKRFWQSWGDNTTNLWTPLTVDNFEEYLCTDSGPRVLFLDQCFLQQYLLISPVITKAVLAAMLVKLPASHAVMFQKNKGGGDDV